MMQLICYKNLSPALQKQTVPRTKSNGMKTGNFLRKLSLSKGIPCLRCFAARAMPELGLPPHGLVDDRLLTGKLGGWECAPNGATRQPLYRGVREVARQKVSIHSTPGALPSYLIKFVNQLMRHGKKGTAIGLLAKSLTIFSGVLENEARNQPHRGALPSIVPATLERRVGIPSFPFYLMSFPGATFGKTFPKGGVELGNLIGLPSSGVSYLYPAHRGVTSSRSSGLRRGLQRFGETPNPWLLKPPISISFSDESDEGSIYSAEKTEIGLRSHTRRPVYFWLIKGASPLSEGDRSSRAGVFVLSYLGRAIANVEPSLEVRKKKIAGITRQIPCVVSKSRGERLAIRWIINSARERVKKRGKGLSECLAEELIDAYNRRGEPRQKRDSLHKTAEANRSFLRYRWW